MAEPDLKTAPDSSPPQPGQLQPADLAYLATYQASDYERPSVTVDIVILTVSEQDLKVLLIRRKMPPYQGLWAMPGGFVGIRESLDEAARRELGEETGVEDVYLEQLYTFGNPDRDPRTRVITVAYFALLEAGKVRTLRAGTDAGEVTWWSMYKLPDLAFDHRQILDYTLQRLRGKLGYSNIAYKLLPEKFTLTELQRVYEVILDEKLDKRNFRKSLSIRELNRPADDKKTYMLEELPETRPGGNYGPTKLFRFIDRVEKIIS
jgi:8-oxo-dGTP diphosphatase